MTNGEIGKMERRLNEIEAELQAIGPGGLEAITATGRAECFDNVGWLVEERKALENQMDRFNALKNE